ncbi:hypothetical protein GWK47_034701 [Chionoecetes opilio]|uniref:Uncharacterized protein n=1 Tax=Chionoecetes opilio TaxID=41210 RepID=A0A8J5CNZ3_CHIOP|nr:hypothetical protein GWK47_034701 [Chionoecetes opilio]
MNPDLLWGRRLLFQSGECQGPGGPREGTASSSSQAAMGGGKDFKSYQVSSIESLALGKKSNKEIARVSLHSVQHWTLKAWQSGDADLSLQKKRPGRPRATSQRTLRFIQRQVDSEPRITAKEFKKKKPYLITARPAEKR